MADLKISSYEALEAGERAIAVWSASASRSLNGIRQNHTKIAAFASTRRDHHTTAARSPALRQFQIELQRRAS